MVQIRAPLLEPLEVPDPCVGCDDDPSAVMVGPPTQVDVVTVEADRRIEPAELAQQVGAHEDARRRQHEHVADGVVLFLVDLTGFDDRVDLAEPVEAEPDVLQPARLFPLDELGTDHPGVRAVQLGDHRPDGVRRRSDVVVAQQEEAVVALDQPEHLVGGRAESRVPGDGADEGGGQVRADPGADGVEELRIGVADDQEQEAHVGVVLAGECRERLVEPWPRVVHDDDGDHRWRLLRVGFHD